MLKPPLLCILVFDDIEKYAPGFKASVIGRDILTPPDMERIFGLTGGVCSLNCGPCHTCSVMKNGSIAVVIV